MRKSLFLTYFYPPEIGGIQTYNLELIRQLPAEFAVVMARQMKGDLKFDTGQDFKTYRLKYEGLLTRLKLTSLKLYRQAGRICRTEGIELVQVGQIFPMGPAALMLKKRRGLPYFVWTYGTEIFEIARISPIRVKLAREILGGAEKVLILADFMKSKLAEYGVSEDKIVKVVPGVDSDVFRPLGESFDLRQKHGISESDLALVTVGRLVERKGQDKVIAALPAVSRQVPEVKYVIVGDGPDRKRLAGLADKLGLRGKVIFAGAVPDPDLVKYYNLGDVFMMPSREIPKIGDIEGFGIVYLEAAACGKPVVAGRTGGAVEAIVDGETGFLVDSENAEELVGKTIKLLKDPDWRARMGQAGRERAVRDFSWERSAKVLEELL